MSASMVLNVARFSLKNNILPGIACVRFASKKAGSTTRNKRSKTNPKYRGWKRNDGCFVHNGEVLAKQLGLNWYPGENVRIGPNNTLYASCDGKVIVSCEKLSPFPESPLYTAVKNGVVIQKKFFNVLPTPLHGKFRLKKQI
ncbi:hypothetical protein ScPMuIL_004924 [Solemya velum]